MDAAIWLQYAWVLLVLIGLEGILAADNAVVLAMMVKHLPEDQRKKALFYGLAGAFVFRFASLFLIAVLINVWQIQAVGAVYLLYLAINFLVRKYLKKNEGKQAVRTSTDGFWKTVIKVELADVAFAVDSVLAAVALAMTLPDTPLPMVGRLDGGQFLVILIGGLIGIVIMRFAAGAFVRVLEKRPGLETGAYLIVGWVGVKLAVYTLSHPAVGIVEQHFAESVVWKVIFWGVMLSIIIISWFFSKPAKEKIRTDNI